MSVFGWLKVLSRRPSIDPGNVAERSNPLLVVVFALPVRLPVKLPLSFPPEIWQERFDSSYLVLCCPVLPIFIYMTVDKSKNRGVWSQYGGSIRVHTRPRRNCLVGTGNVRKWGNFGSNTGAENGAKNG